MDLARRWAVTLKINKGLIACREPLRVFPSTASLKQATCLRYMDHASTTGIVTQTSLKTSATDELNLRLVRASQYIQQFRILVHHKPGKPNIIADALSRLLAGR
jgi:hypothetical protein